MESMVIPESVAIVALGKNWQKTKHPPQPIDGTTVFASMDTYQTAIAAGLVWLKRKEEFGDDVQDIIEFSTGHTLGEPDEYGVNHYPTEADMMHLKFRQVFSPEEIPDEALFKEQCSIDTAGNAEEVGKNLRGRGINEAIVVTVKRHEPRAGILFRNHNPDLRIITAITEKILEENHIKVIGLPLIEKVKETILEAGMRVLLYNDPSGKGITRRITQLIRK
jgi:hypothetical protein